MTRHWYSHGIGIVSVAECTRAMQSLIDMLGIIAPVLLACPSDANATLDSIQGRIARVESLLSYSDRVEISVESHACLIFMRALECLRVAVGSELEVPHGIDIIDAIQRIPKIRTARPVHTMLCDVVLKGRNYLVHGSDVHNTLALVQCTCAVAQLLRFLYRQSPARFLPKEYYSAASSMPKAHAETFPGYAAADDVETSALQLMDRMGISDVDTLLKDIVVAHSDM